MFRKTMMLVPALLILAACGVSSNEGVVSREENTGGFLGMSTLDQVEVEGDLSVINQMVIGSFTVGFVESSTESKQAGNFFSRGSGGKATGRVRLAGVDDAVKQAITDSAFDDFKARLMSSGFTVVERDAFTGSPAYQSASKTSFPMMNDESGLFSSYGETKLFQPTAFGAQGLQSGGTWNMNASKVVEYAKASNTAVVEATYLVDFAATGGHEGAFSASINVGQNLAVSTASVKFTHDWTSTFQNGSPTVSLGQAVEADTVFGEVVDDSSGAEMAVEEAANVLSVLMGGGTSRSRNYIIQADPAKYEEAARDVLVRTNEMLLAKAPQ
ncbi:MAG: hypothetical protein AAF213_04225 [Pseudomonadota bacterium]